MTPRLEELVDLGLVTPAELARLRGVHDLLLRVGPPADEPVAARAQARPAAPRWRRRPALAAVAAACAVALVSFGSGYLLASQAPPHSLRATEVVSLQGAGPRDSFASLLVGSADRDGNWPVTLTVTGLPQLTAASARYVLMLWRDGHPTSLCGNFKVGKVGPTTVSFTVPYPITKTTRWVVTEMTSGQSFPGRIVMRSD